MAEAITSTYIPQHQTSVGSIVSSSSNDVCHSNNPQSRHKPISLAILKQKKATNFSDGLWSRNYQGENSCRELADATPIVANALTALDIHSVGMKIANVENVQIPSVITPPPQMNKTTSIHRDYGNHDVKTRPGTQAKRSGPSRLNKFVRRLHEMLLSEHSSGIVEWRKGLLVLHSTDAFTKKILPKYFGTKNFKTFRRQLNYYGFVHVRSFSATGSTTTALWVNQDLAKHGTKSISSVLMLKRVEPSETSKTAEGRRVRKEEAANTVEDIGINTQNSQLEQIRSLATKKNETPVEIQEVSTQNYKDNVMSCQVSNNGTESISSNASTSMRSEPQSFPPVPSSIHVTYQSNTNNVLTSSDTSTDNAANLLMMLSRSAI